MTLNGIGVSKGCGIGKATVLQIDEPDYYTERHRTATQEKERLQRAAHAFAAETKAMAKTLAQTADEETAAIAFAQLTMLRDPYFLLQAEQQIEDGSTAEAAVKAVCGNVCAAISAASDVRLRQRAADVRDMQNRLIQLLSGKEAVSPDALPQGTVLVAEHLPPSFMIQLRPGQIAAIVTEMTGITSHSAILARAMGIPAVFAVEQATARIQNGNTVLADGYHGRVFLAPTAAEMALYKERQTEYKDAQRQLALHRQTEKNRATAQVYGNIDRAEDVQAVLQNGGAGIGLFRTEYLFLGKDRAPHEAKQVEIYTAIAKAMAGKEVIVRTWDIGGDKAVPWLPSHINSPPLPDERGIRFCLRHTALFQTQLRALLRAAVYGNIKIMLPFVTDAREIKEVKALLKKCIAALEKESVPYRLPPLGVMIETPAAVLIADTLAKEADFFSVGTNDLTACIMATDRETAREYGYTEPLPPAVLRAVEMAVNSARAAEIRVGICGEAAADTRLIPRLVAAGIDTFSVAPPFIPAVKNALTYPNDT